MKVVLFSVLALVAAPSLVWAEDLTVKFREVDDPKAVYATVETVDTVAAPARIEGTIATLSVKEGDAVEAGQEIALIGDEKLALQLKSLEAQILAQKAQSSRAYADLKRAKELISSSSISKSEMDRVQATATSAANGLKALEAQRGVIEQQMADGIVRAPSIGRVLQVPVTVGTVVMPGQAVAMVAVESYLLRLRVPERHASLLKIGGKVRVDGSEMGAESVTDAEISLIYPGIENGMVTVDATAPGIGTFYVGKRLRVWVPTTKRSAILVPEKFVTTRSGIDYVHLKSADGVYEVPVQRGQTDAAGQTGEIEILSGVRDGDVLMAP
ncbi:MAG TPA: efflux RND transporter periplasmic adaptor subunit [Alphaproteobacteria bacterium]|nr:efflux RND transporter periplasmic adaptor subunit [Alphaproteobacteria bacterium]HNS43888.1 efflux RND transporter periplasmic adaptor subunit [Alphaproteobacteria bacterium]